MERREARNQLGNSLRVLRCANANFSFHEDKLGGEAATAILGKWRATLLPPHRERKVQKAGDFVTGKTVEKF